MKHLVLATIILLSCCVNAATNPGEPSPRCYNDGDSVSLRGVASPVMLKMANGTVSKVWVLTTETPVCVMEQAPWNDAPKQITVLRVQVIGSAPPLGSAVELKGKLSTGNITQYYAEPTAITVTSGRKISASVPPNPSVPTVPATPAAVPSVPADGEDVLSKQLIYCLMPKAQYGQYSSYDGGKSAASLLQDACPSEYLAWVNNCKRLGTSERQCILAAAVTAQKVIKSFGK
ncbi:MAG: hypothetical protein ABSD88_03645 [Candidatus Korobacteraceae bacterium]